MTEKKKNTDKGVQAGPLLAPISDKRLEAVRFGGFTAP